MKRKLLIVLTVAMVCLPAWAQYEKEDMGGLAMHIGYASPTLRLNSPLLTNSHTLESTPMSGLKVGLAYDATLVAGFGTVIGANYTYALYQSKWTESTSGYTTQKTSYRSTYHGLELFVDWQYKIEIAQDFYVILYTGPTVQCALSYREDAYTLQSDGTKTTSVRKDYEYRDNQAFEDFNRLNVTWGVGAGIQFNKFFIRGGYDFGLMNPYRKSTFKQIDPVTYANCDYYTRGRFDQWQIKIGVYLWRLND